MVGAGKERAELSRVLKNNRSNVAGAINWVTPWLLAGIQGALCLGRCFRVLAVKVAWGLPEASLHVFPSRGLQIVTCLLQRVLESPLLNYQPPFRYHYLALVDEASLQQPDAENRLVVFSLQRC